MRAEPSELHDALARACPDNCVAEVTTAVDNIVFDVINRMGSEVEELAQRFDDSDGAPLQIIIETCREHVESKVRDYYNEHYGERW